MKPIKDLKPQEAWFGIDSIHGRYQFGRDEGPENGIVLPKQTCVIVETPYIPFKPERLFVHRSCASDFLIRQCYIGAECGPFVNMEPIIAEPFAVDFDALTAIKWDELAIEKKEKPILITIERTGAEFIGQPFPCPTLHPGLHLTFNVENIGNEPRRFLGAFLGRALL